MKYTGENTFYYLFNVFLGDPCVLILSFIFEIMILLFEIIIIIIIENNKISCNNH